MKNILSDILSNILSEDTKNVIIDLDTGADGDDQFALAYSLSERKKLNILGVCSEPFNEAAEMVKQGAKENREIIALSGRDIPSFQGAGDYISSCGKAVKSDASEFIYQAAMSSDEPVYVIMSGCCTNTASAIMMHPEINDKIVAVWLAMADIYGDNAGNDYNFMNDPLAGQFLVNCGVPFLLVPATLINPFAATKDEIDDRFGKETPMCRWLTNRFREITWAQGLWDLGVNGILICPKAYEWKIVDAPILDEKGNVTGFDSERQIILTTKIDTDMIWSDAVNRIQQI